MLESEKEIELYIKQQMQEASREDKIKLAKILENEKKVEMNLK